VIKTLAIFKTKLFQRIQVNPMQPLFQQSIVVILFDKTLNISNIGLLIHPPPLPP